MACRSGCLTQDHASWGECARAASLRVGWMESTNGLSRVADRKNDAELARYREARAAGVQPAGTRTHQINEAMELSAKAGAAYDASTQTFSNGAHFSPKTGQIVNV